MSHKSYNQLQNEGPVTLELYADAGGNEPFTSWLESFRDLKTRYRIIARLDRVESGNFGDFKVLGPGLIELRLHFGSGYRVYCGLLGNRVLLLGGGDKRSQMKDIFEAHLRFSLYLEGKE
jgi:putative addiction module killer protein